MTNKQLQTELMRFPDDAEIICFVGTISLCIIKEDGSREYKDIDCRRVLKFENIDTDKFDNSDKEK